MTAMTKTITYSELKHQQFCNSKKLNKVIHGGKLLYWTGIGYVDVGEPTEEDKEKYPVVVSDKS